MTQPPNGQGPQPREVRATEARTDLYGELGLDRRKTSAGLYQDLDTILRQNPNDPRRQQLLDAQAVLGSVLKRRQYDELIGSDGRVAVSEVRDLAQRPESAVPLTKSSSWTSPIMIAGYAIFGLLIVAVIIFGAVSCGEDGEPAADPNPGPVSTATDGETYSLSDVKSGRAKFETVRTIDVAAMVPAASILGSKIGPTATQNFLIANEDGTLTLRWHGYADKYEWAELRVSDPAKVLDHGTDTANAAQVAALEAARGRSALSEEVQSAQVVKLGDTMYMVSSGRSGTQYAGKLYEVKIVEK
ncbi:hypothetical protein GII33_09070 [Gordonia pseudamarae]|uniref:hypothetical protein n=1 Tax=Gordonia TaxID=2053 RepID=UPI00198F03B7|nr:MULTISPECIES: hypothetical protein [Gordonia]MBD0021067.1 hypothetical protein [Gordonia sp. (in: high G+C Gram-positive bacteria)]QHN26095.1 hypothetical protein GII33_09070 [Gordonia pseudamarae]